MHRKMKTNSSSSSYLSTGGMEAIEKNVLFFFDVGHAYHINTHVFSTSTGSCSNDWTRIKTYRYSHARTRRRKRSTSDCFFFQISCKYLYAVMVLTIWGWLAQIYFWFGWFCVDTDYPFSKTTGEIWVIDKLETSRLRIKFFDKEILMLKLSGKY